MAPTTLTIDTPQSGVVVLTLNRPERLNALNEVLVQELREACAAIAEDPEVRVVVLTGAGRGFCAGIDLRGFGPSAPTASAPAIDRLAFQEMMGALPQCLRDLPQPVIAAVNGPAVGGGMALCLASDVRICGASAKFGNGAVRIGLSGAEMGMSYHLPRIVGTSVAADWMLTGRIVDADEALRAGLVSALVDDDQLLDHALELAAQIAANSQFGVQLTKRALQVNTDASDLNAALAIENRNQVLAHGSEESQAAWANWSRK